MIWVYLTLLVIGTFAWGFSAGVRWMLWRQRREKETLIASGVRDAMLRENSRKFGQDVHRILYHPERGKGLLSILEGRDED